MSDMRARGYKFTEQTVIISIKYTHLDKGVHNTQQNLIVLLAEML